MKSIFVSILITLFVLNCQPECPEQPAEAKLFFSLGEVFINQQKAQFGQLLNSGDLITTGENSTAEIKLDRNSGIQIRANSVVQLLYSKKAWATEVKKGAVLNLVQGGKSYRLKGPSAVIAVRGTIFYVHAYEDSSQYNCICNGTLELEAGLESKSVSASHHDGYTVSPTVTGKVFEPAGMKEHDDVEIFEFMYRMNESLKDVN